MIIINYATIVWVFLVGVISGWWWWWKKQRKVVIILKSSSSRDEKVKMMKVMIKGGGEIPRGNQGWPFIGETLDFIACGYSSRPLSFMEKRKSLYGKVFKSHLLGIPVIVSTDGEVNKVVLQNNGSTFVPYYPKSITELLGNSSILQMNGGLQRRVHGIIGSFLKSPQLKVRITREIECIILDFMDTWKLHSASTSNKKPLIYIQEETKNIAFQVLISTLMGIGPGEELEFLKREFREFIKGLICLPIKLPGTRLYRSLKAKERLLRMVRSIVEEKKQKMEKLDHDHHTKSGPTHLDAIDVLLAGADDHQSPSDHEIQRLPVDFISGNIVEMMIPGEDSVPMLMTLAVKFLGDSRRALDHLLILSAVSDQSIIQRFETMHERHVSLDWPCARLSGTYAYVALWGEVTGLSFVTLALSIPNTFYKNLPVTSSVPFIWPTLEIELLSMEENLELKSKKVSTGEDYAWTDYMALTFTQNVISETLRLGNIINAVWRKALKDVEIKGHLIPEGWCVLASFTSVHMDEQNYDDPCKFDPWRWQNKEGRLLNSSSTTFTPFGGGHRLCPGMEMARLEVSIFLHHFVTRFRWEAEEDYVVTFPTVKMKRKLPVTVTPLSTCPL
ncbi:hypothetical protein Sjap_010257 [Stephania japonica]|uniref:Cytochrome P450 n=1 Tax=Stephania japonica TaxID=461633 RepID=A0AAP0JA15_9MAGN